ncbi:MAG: glycosyltransferase family A protein [Candidatus Limnocylindria bacterium]
MVVPAYNATTTLGEPSEALGQYEDDGEVVIVDDGSTQRHRGLARPGHNFAGLRLVE